MSGDTIVQFIIDYDCYSAPLEGPITNISRIAGDKVNVSWDPLSLEKTRGFVTKYTVSAEAEFKVQLHRRQEPVTTVAGNRSWVVLENIDRNLAYSIFIAAHTSAGMGPSAKISLDQDGELSNMEIVLK